MLDFLPNLDPEDVIRITRDLVQIPSVNPPGDETRVAEYISHELAKLGFEVDLYEVNKSRSNVVGLLRGKMKGPTLMLNGHTDVVPPGELSSWNFAPFGATILGDRIYGRGTADMKGAIAAMLSAVNALVNSGVELTGNLLFAAVIDEEQRGLGTRSLLERGYTADMAVTGEPTELKVQIAHKGVIWLEVTTLGEAMHASRVRSRNPPIGINAIYKMAKIVDAIEKFSVELERRDKHPLLGSPTINVGTISGGIIPWAVPAFCKIAVDRRILPHETGEMGKKELEEIVNKLRREDPELVAEVKIHGGAPAMETSEDHVGVRRLREAVASVTGQDPGIKGAPYTTDGGILVNEGKIPTVIFGPGDIRQAHRPDEFIAIEEMITAAKVYALTAHKLLS